MHSLNMLKLYKRVRVGEEIHEHIAAVEEAEAIPKTDYSFGTGGGGGNPKHLAAVEKEGDLSFVNCRFCAKEDSQGIVRNYKSYILRSTIICSDL